jgi:hypothetical protein
MTAVFLQLTQEEKANWEVTCVCVISVTATEPDLKEWLTFSPSSWHLILQDNKGIRYPGETVSTQIQDLNKI